MEGIQVAAGMGSPRGLMASPSKSKKRRSQLARQWMQNAALVALLVGLPVVNLIMHLSPDTLRGSSRGSRDSATASEPQGYGDDAQQQLGGAGGGEDQSLALPVSETLWPDFVSQISAHPLFHRYQRYYASDHRAIQHYGKVVVVVDQFLGPNEASGPATAMTTLAELMATNGYDVTVLLTRGKTVQKGTWEIWEQYWGGRGLRLAPLPDSSVEYDVDEYNALSHRVYTWLLKSESYDVAHFSDAFGMAYWTLKAKYQGLAFQRMATVMHFAAPHLWRKVAGLESIDDVTDLVVDYMQRESVALADLVVSPSQFMLRWAEENNWRNVSRPRAVLHTGQLLPAWVKRRARPVPEEMPFTEVVFFSRLELCKGLVLFCDVLDRIERRSPEVLRGVKVTFLGRVPEDQTLPLPGNLHAQTDEYVRSRGVKWNSFTWTILQDMDTQARIDYMMAGSRLAVFPMIAENSPYAILECLVAGIPFLATRIGGVDELLILEDRERLLTEATPKAITKRLAEVLREGLRPGQPPTHHVPEDLERAWVVWHHLAMHNMETMGMDASMQLQRHPLVTVCIVHFNNPVLLQQALDSLINGHYQNIEVVIVDDGSTDPEAQQYLEDLNLKFQAKGWKIGQQYGRGPGAGRNLAASLANPNTEYFMFMDDDNVAKPQEILTFLSVAMHTGAAVLTCVNDYFFGNDYPEEGHQPTGRWAPLGAAREVGIFQNMYGDTNAMVRRDVFLAVGGFPEDFGYAMEDWELFSKCVLAGYHLESVPDPLYWYRLRETSHSRVTATHSNNMRTVRPYLKTIPKSMHHLIMFAQGMKSSHDHAQKELQKEEGNTVEMKNMLKALASSLHALCEDGKLPEASKNRLSNPDFELAGTLKEGYPAAGWKPFEKGYVLDQRGGRPGPVVKGRAPWQNMGGAVKMTNLDWRQSSGAMRQVVLNQGRPGAVVVSGWSKAEKVSGHADGGYALYVDVVYKDGSKLWGYEIPFSVGTHDWEYKASVLDPEVPIEWLQVYLMFRWHAGTVWFDDVAVSLLKEGICDYSKIALDGIGEAVPIS